MLACVPGRTFVLVVRIDCDGLGRLCVLSLLTYFYFVETRASKLKAARQGLLE